MIIVSSAERGAWGTLPQGLGLKGPNYSEKFFNLSLFEKLKIHLKILC